MASRITKAPPVQRPPQLISGQPPVVRASGADWGFVETDTTRTVIPTREYFIANGINWTAAVAAADLTAKQELHEIKIDLDASASITMMALFILDILHDNSSTRGGWGIVKHFANLAAKMTKVPSVKRSAPAPENPRPLYRSRTLAGGTTVSPDFQLMVTYILYGIIGSVDDAYSGFIAAIIKKCYELAGTPKDITKSAFPPNNEKDVLGRIMNDSKSNVHILKANDASPSLKPLELMFDQGTSVAMSLLGVFPALSISAINKMDMGDSYRTLLHIGPAMVAIMNPEQKPARKCPGNDIPACIKKSIAYVNTYYSEGSGTPSTKRPEPIKFEFIRGIVRECVLVFNEANLREKVSKEILPIHYRPGVEHTYIEYIESEFIFPIETIIRERGLKTEATIIDAINISTENTLLKKYIPNRNSSIIIEGFRAFKQDAVNDALGYNYIVHKRPVNIVINITPGNRSSPVRFFSAEYSIDKDFCAQMMLGTGPGVGGRLFKSTFSAAEVGKWIKLNSSNEDAMKANLTLACLAKYVGDLNQFIYGFYMGIAVASEDTSAIANAVFLMNYISSDEARLKNFKNIKPNNSPSQYRSERGMIIATSVPRIDIENYGFGIRYITNKAGKEFIKTVTPGARETSLNIALSQRFELATPLTRLEQATAEQKESMIEQLKNYAIVFAADAFTPRIKKWSDEIDIEKAAATLVAIKPLNIAEKEKIQRDIDLVESAIKQLSVQIGICEGRKKKTFQDCYKTIAPNLSKIVKIRSLPGSAAEQSIMAPAVRAATTTAQVAASLASIAEETGTRTGWTGNISERTTAQKQRKPSPPMVVENMEE